MGWVELYRVICGTVSLLLSKAGCRADRRPGGSGSAQQARSAGGNWLAHGTPAAKIRGGDRRTAKIEDHAAFILKAIEQQPDPTMVELREMLATRGASVSIATLWRFFARHGITRKNGSPELVEGNGYASEQDRPDVLKRRENGSRDSSTSIPTRWSLRQACLSGMT